MPPTTESVPQRVMSVDALRGFDMFWIVGGNPLIIALAGVFSDPVPEWLRYHLGHPAWEGFSAWDLIMPLFLFIVGTAMPFSFTRRIEEGQNRGQLYGKILRRVVILFVFGMAAQGSLLAFDMSTLHIFCNTLQAIAAGYLVAGFVMLNLPIFGQVLIAIVLLVFYWVIMMFVPFGGHPAGTLKPDANVALAVDEFVLGRFRDGTSYTWVLSSMGFAATTLLGVFSGHVLRARIPPRAKIGWLILIGMGCLIGGWAWAEWLGFPIIKHIWTSSMTLWAAGWSYLLLALFYTLIDVARWHRWAFPFMVIGANAITAYMAVRFISFRNTSEKIVGGLAELIGDPGGIVLTKFTTVLLLWLVLWYLYRQKVFLRI